MVDWWWSLQHRRSNLQPFLNVFLVRVTIPDTDLANTAIHNVVVVRTGIINIVRIHVVILDTDSFNTTILDADPVRTRLESVATMPKGGGVTRFIHIVNNRQCCNLVQYIAIDNVDI
jgi:hypothetical protein